jgi:hypothetical protein
MCEINLSGINCTMISDYLRNLCLNVLVCVKALRFELYALSLKCGFNRFVEVAGG